MEEQPASQPEAQTNRRGAMIFGAAVVVVAIVVVVLFMFVGKEDPACDEWEQAKNEWVSSFPPIQRQTNADLANFQGYVDLDGERVTRPEGC